MFLHELVACSARRRQSTVLHNLPDYIHYFSLIFAGMQGFADLLRLHRLEFSLKRQLAGCKRPVDAEGILSS
jgi:hypothetical protein